MLMGLGVGGLRSDLKSRRLTGRVVPAASIRWGQTRVLTSSNPGGLAVWWILPDGVDTGGTSCYIFPILDGKLALQLVAVIGPAKLESTG